MSDQGFLDNLKPGETLEWLQEEMGYKDIIWTLCPAEWAHDVRYREVSDHLRLEYQRRSNALAREALDARKRRRGRTTTSVECDEI